jgi:hypothetical protein
MVNVKSIIIRCLDETTQTRLQLRAARGSGSSRNLANQIHARFAALGGFNMPDVPREPAREPLRFGA